MARLNVTASTATTITVDGREVLAFGGCNYLGLAHHPEVVQALAEGALNFGLSTTASRETTGNTAVHEDLERDLARWMNQDAAILLAEGYTANIALAQALARDHGIALIDAKAHRSLRAAATAAGMQVFEYEHRSPTSAAWLCRQYGDQGVAILTDGVFAADGALAPIPGLLDVLPGRRATLVVDDCHGVAVLGARGSGTVEHFGIRDERIAITTTLAKGVGCYGGAVIGRRKLIDSVREHADVYRRSTPVPTPFASAARAAVGVIERQPALLDALRRNIAQVRGGLNAIGIGVHGEDAPIFTFVLDPRERMPRIHHALLTEGLYAPLIEYPGGPTDQFFRITVTAAHTPEQIDRLLAAFARHCAA
ncbi:glycine C-acetyltransferase [Phycisphaerales bacterium]|nr:glycine C-acetyltransferase [Phycisphaerales bacterium]